MNKLHKFCTQLEATYTLTPFFNNVHYINLKLLMRFCNDYDTFKHKQNPVISRVREVLHNLSPLSIFSVNLSISF